VVVVFEELPATLLLDTLLEECPVVDERQIELYDFGDLVRSAVSDTDEDERDYMAFSAKLIAYELGIRFLADYLNGDPYFKTSREGQNLDRCRAQFALARDIERKEEVMSRLVEQF